MSLLMSPYHTAQPDSALFARLTLWAERTPGLHPIWVAPYRLQLEFWVWQHLTQRKTAGLRTARVLDVGQPQEYRRAWACDAGGVYETFGGLGINPDDVHPDRLGDLLDRASLGDDWDAIIATEVLEHCEAPFLAVRHIHEALAPGGLFVASSPFCWPEHGCDGYPDLWRFARQGWERLLRPFGDGPHVEVVAAEWASERGRCAAELLRQGEAMGQRDQVMTPGYLVAATKATP